MSAWVALVMLTLQELGIKGVSGWKGEIRLSAESGLLTLRPPPQPPSPLEAASGISEDQARFLQGMRAYVQQTLTLYDQGYTLDKLRGLQSLVQNVSQRPGGERHADGASLADANSLDD